MKTMQITKMQRKKDIYRGSLNFRFKRVRNNFENSIKTFKIQLVVLFIVLRVLNF